MMKFYKKNNSKNYFKQNKQQPKEWDPNLKLKKMKGVKLKFFCQS